MATNDSSGMFDALDAALTPDAVTRQNASNAANSGSFFVPRTSGSVDQSAPKAPSMFDTLDAGIAGKIQPIEPEVAHSSWTDLGSQLGAGLSKGVIARTLGGPVDLATAWLNRAHREASGTDEAPYSAPVGGSEWIASHLLPAAPPIKNEGERLINEFGQGAGEAVGMAAGVGGASALTGKAMATAKAAVGSPDLLNAAIGGAAAVGGDIAANQQLIPVPDKYKPLVATVAGLGAGVPIVAAHAATTLGRSAADAALAATTRGGAELKVGQELQKAASDAQAAKEALAGPGAAVPNVNLTTGQQSGDMGVLGWERGIRQNNSAAFNTREAAQNEALTEHLGLIQPQGDTAALPVMIAGQRDAAATAASQREQGVDIRTAGMVSQAEAAHVNAVNNLRSVGPDASPVELAAHFRAVRNSLDAMTLDNVKGAQARAGAASDAVAPRLTAPEDVGAAIRAPAAEAKKNAADTVNKMYDELEKSGNVQVPSGPIAKAAKDIPSSRVEESRAMTKEEERLFGLAQDYGPTAPLKNVRALRSSVLTEMANTRRSDPESYGRLNQLRTAIDDSLDHAAENQFALDKIALVHGTLKPENSLSSRIDGVLDEHYSQKPDAAAANAEVPGTGTGRGPGANVAAAGATGEKVVGPGDVTGGAGVSKGPGAQAGGINKSIDPKVQKVLSDPTVQRMVTFPNKIDRTHDVPYLAGSSKAGGTTYIDSRVPTNILVNGKSVDPSKYLNIHEQVEHALMEKGKMSYDDAHKVATEYERHAVEGDGHDWNAYEKVMDGLLSHIEHEKPINPPSDLYTKPYPAKKAEAIEARENANATLDNAGHFARWKAADRALSDAFDTGDRAAIEKATKDLMAIPHPKSSMTSAAPNKIIPGETVKNAAIRLTNGKIHEGSTHMEAAENFLATKKIPKEDFIKGMDAHGDKISEDGFTTSTGRFVDRKEAMEIAERAHGQIGSGDSNLYAEDLNEARSNKGLSPQDVIAKLKAANEQYRSNKETFDKGPVGDILAKQARGQDYELSNAEVAKKVFHPGDTGGEDVRAYIKAAEGKTPETIKRAAFKVNGKVYQGGSHYEALQKAIDAGNSEDDVLAQNEDGGFITSKGRYIYRDEAIPIAEESHGMTFTSEEKRARLIGSDSIPRMSNVDVPTKLPAIQALEDAATYSFNKTAMKNGELNPKAGDKWVADHATALRELPPEIQAKFKDATTAQRSVEEALASRKEQLDGFDKSTFAKIAGLDRNQDVVAHMASIMTSKDAATQMGDLAKAVRGNVEASRGMRRAILESVFDKFLPETGAAKLDKINDFFDKNSEALSRIFKPAELKAIQSRLGEARYTEDLTGRVGEARAAALKSAAAQTKQAMSEYEKGILGRLLKVEGRGNVIDVLSSLFGGSNSAKEMATLMDKAKSVEGGVDAVRKGVQEMLERDYTGTARAGVTETPEIARARLAKFFKENTDTLEKTFTPEQVGKLRAIIEDQHKINRTINAIKLKGGSDTAQNLAAMAHSGEHSGLGHMALNAAGLIIGEHMLGTIGALAGGLGGHIAGAFRNSGINKLNQVRVEAALDPQLASKLLERAKGTPSRNALSLIALRLRQLSLASTLAGSRQPNK